MAFPRWSVRNKRKEKKGVDMPTKTPVSNAGTYQEIGAFWDDHDATEFGEQTNATFQVRIGFIEELSSFL